MNVSGTFSSRFIVESPQFRIRFHLQRFNSYKLVCVMGKCDRDTVACWRRAFDGKLNLELASRIDTRRTAHACMEFKAFIGGARRTHGLINFRCRLYVIEGRPHGANAIFAPKNDEIECAHREGNIQMWSDDDDDDELCAFSDRQRPAQHSAMQHQKRDLTCRMKFPVFCSYFSLM